MVTFKICTFVYLNVDYHHQEHFFGREWNDSQFQNIRGEVKVMKFWIVCPLKTLIFGRSKHLFFLFKILANTFSDSLAILNLFFAGVIFHTKIPGSLPVLITVSENDYSRSLPILLKGTHTTSFFRHPRRIFWENFESHRRVRRSAARRCERRAHRDRKLFLRANLQ